MTTPIKTIVSLTSDKALGAVGGSLAVASLGFGVYMNVHGPAPGSFGNSGHFTVFAQLAPRGRTQPPPPTAAPNKPSAEDLDMTATASIPKPGRAAEPAARQNAGRDIRQDAGQETRQDTRQDAAIEPADAAIISSATIEAANADAANIVVGGRTRTVRVGDHVPGVGEVLEIRPGRNPLVRTTRGYIVSARED